MIEFKNKIVQLGFGAVGKSFFEKVPYEIKFDINNYFVISKDKLEYTFFIELGGKVGNFIIADINRNNYQKIFNEHLSEGDFLIDFTDGVGTKDFVEWCANKNVFYLNTGETDWDDNWYSIFEEYSKKNTIKEEFKKNKNLNKYPVVVHHGNNPGLVSHFVKAGIEYIVKNQFKNDIKLNELLKRKQFNSLAKELGLMQIHVNDNDLQIIKDKFYEDKLFSTWSIDSFFFEMLSNATANIGTNEIINRTEDYNMLDLNNGFLEFKEMAIDKCAKTFYPKRKDDRIRCPS